MAKYKKKKKGITYVSSVLRKYGGKKYSKGTESRAKAKEIYSDLKAKGDKVTIKSILAYVKAGKEPKQQIPSIPDEMLNVNNYFILTDYPRLIQTETSNKLTFISRVSDTSLPSIKGGSKPDYNTYFKPFVDYCNELANLSEEGTYNEDWFVRTRLYDAKKLIYEIIPCTGDGVEFYYGFDRNKTDKVPEQSITTNVGGPKKEEVVEPAKESEKEISKQTLSEKDKEIELSKEKQKEYEKKTLFVEKRIQLIQT
jgi:hypothetical protein